VTDWTRQCVEQLARAVKRACDENDRPNSFAPAELTINYGGPEPMMIGLIGRRYIYGLWQALGGSARWGSCPVYSGRRFYV